MLLKNKLKVTDITFDELFKKTNIKLEIGITNLTTNKFELWSFYNKPQFSIIEAITISCNLPFVFEPIKINNEYLVDGGVLNNFPINFFTKEEYSTTLGICCNNFKNLQFENMFEYISKIFSMITSNKDIIKIENYENQVDIIKIDSEDNILDFELDALVIKKRIDTGYHQALKFFSAKKLDKRRHSI